MRAAVLAVVASLLLVSCLSGQLRRRGVIVTPPGDSAGRLLVGLGAGLDGDAVFPLSGLDGDLARLGSVTLAYVFAPGAVFEVKGDALRILDVDGRRRSAVPLDEDVSDGRTRDAGEVRVGTRFRLLGDARGLSGGLHLEVKLPTSDERRGIGLNTTDFFGNLYGSWGRGPWRVNAELGVGIMEAPLDRFVQDDVLSYGAEVLLRPRGTPLRLALSAEGWANTRRTVPLGTEDRGAAWTRAELLASDWILDAGLGLGYAGTSPEWSVELGIARLLEP